MTPAQVWVETHRGGRLLSAEADVLGLTDRGFAYGDGLFETTRILKGQPLFLDRHLRRLRGGLDLLGFPALAWEDAALAERARRVIAANDVHDGVLRLIITRGPGPRGFEPPANPHPTLIVQAAARTSSPGDAAPSLSAIIAPWKIDPASPLCRVKHLSALDKVIAKQLARQSGADEALFQNIHGQLTEATAWNLFVVAEGQLLTPARHCGILPGITREILLETSPALGYPGLDAEISPAQLFAAAEAFLTNAVAGIRPLVSVAGHPLGSGQPGPITKIMLEHYDQVCEQAAR